MRLKQTLAPLLAVFLLVNSIYTAKVAEIIVRTQGAVTTDKDFVLAYTGIKPGDTFDRAAVVRDIDALKATDRFSFVNIEAKQIDPDHISLIYVLELKPRLKSVPVIIGAREIGQRKIRNLLDLKVGDPVDDSLLAVKTSKIVEEYHKRFFHAARVTWSIELDKNEEFADVVISITENAKSSVRSITFTGNKNVSSRELKDILYTKTWNILSFLNKRGVFEAELLERDRVIISEYYRNLGFLDVAVENPEIYLSFHKIYIVFNIREGNRYKVDKISLTGNSIFDDKTLAPYLTLKPGDIASSGKINNIQTAIENHYRSRGYIKTYINTSISNADEPDTVNVSFALSEGTLVYTGNIEIRGNVQTRDSVARRELLVYPGEVFNQPALKRSERVLENLGFFSSVVSYERPTLLEDRLDIVFDVTEKPTGQFMIGAGYSSVDKIIGYVELSQGNFDLFGWPSLKGAGQKVRARAQLGTRRTDLELSFIENWFLDRKLSFGVDLYYRERGYLSSNFDERRISGAITLGKPLKVFFRRANLRYGLEEISIYDVSDN
ncbi:MAG: outer membrane protein assembly factor BamA, partial [Lentisphaerae bacterium]|nr:outer membrane protein assembly factor BamA [Lentisphaerota bacterium]